MLFTSPIITRFSWILTVPKSEEKKGGPQENAVGDKLDIKVGIPTYCTLRNEMERNEMKICSWRNENV